MKVLKDKKDFVINGDIGCYEIAGFGNDENNPHEEMRDLIDTIYVMGSGISISQGMQKAGYKGKILALVGDSTFFHAALQGLINAVQNNSKIMYIVFDDRCTAMTGHQLNPSSFLNIEEVCKSIKVPFVRTVKIQDMNELEKTFREAYDFNGLSVVIAEGECILFKMKNLGITRGGSK